jgi:hypothetical protein
LIGRRFGDVVGTLYFHTSDHCVAYGTRPGYEDALVIDDSSPEQRLALAGEMLETCSGLVMLDGVVALRPLPGVIRCEVIDPTPSAHRCEEEFKVLVENAGRRLGASRLASRLPRRLVQWLVVEDGETGIVELWTAPPSVNPE